MNKKTIVLLVISSMIFTIGLMNFGRHGSFDPSEVGFYTSIGAGVLWFLGMFFAFKKFIKRKSNEKKS